MPKAPTTAKTSTTPNTMTGLAGWVEVFKAGDHVASNGKPISFSQADLDQMIVNHKLGAAPAVIGHPKKTARAWAWVDEYKREGDVLFAKFTDIDPTFEAGVKSKAYRNRSLSVWPDKKHGWRVRHVGWLGAEPPAIDGLADVDFSGDEADALEFSAPGYSLVWGVESIVRLLRGLREQIVAKDGIEAADAVLPQWQIDSAMDAVSQARTQFDAAEAGRDFSQHNPGGSMTTFTQAQLDEAKAQARQEAEDKAKLEFSAKEQELIKLQAERQAERIKTQIEGWTGKGLVTPAEAHGLAEFMAALEDQGAVEFEFSAHDGKPAKKTPTQFFAEFMASRGPVVKLGLLSGGAGNDPGAAGGVVEFSSQPGYAGVKVDSERAAVDGRIKDFMKKNNVDYATAASRVMAG